MWLKSDTIVLWGRLCLGFQVSVRRIVEKEHGNRQQAALGFIPVLEARDLP